jgi:2-dehydropantoate 2-reductase
MTEPRMAVVGIGATGAVLAAALLKHFPDTVLVESFPGAAEAIRQNGIEITGMIEYKVPVKNVVTDLKDLGEPWPQLILLSTKTFHLPRLLDDMAGVWRPGTRLVSTHNGLGTEDLIAERFGPESALRMSLNYGVRMTAPGRVEATFFNRPNHLGVLDPAAEIIGGHLARVLTQAGLDTELVPDIKRFIWKKMVMKCTMASICAVTDRTIRDCLDYPPTREIADRCFDEILAVARAKGYDLGPDYMTQAMGYLEKVGAHKDSMCVDLANKTPTEIDFLGGKVVEYARETGVEVPFYRVMTNLVRALENSYLKG